MVECRYTAAVFCTVRWVSTYYSTQWLRVTLHVTGRIIICTSTRGGPVFIIDAKCVRGPSSWHSRHRKCCTAAPAPPFLGWMRTHTEVVRCGDNQSISAQKSGPRTKEAAVAILSHNQGNAHDAGLWKLSRDARSQSPSIVMSSQTNTW